MGEKSLEFRLLRADEIDVRIGTVSEKGVSLLLYKDARCDQNILDETVGPMGWQRHHTRDNANCIVAIRDPNTGEWIEKEDTGTESFTEKEKGLASDSFKRACFNWGVGRELYTAPFLWIGADKLKGIAERNGKLVCNDKFKVKSIEYVGRVISKVEIAVYERYTEYASYTFSNNVSTPAAAQKTKTGPAPAPEPAKTTEKPAEDTTGNAETLFKDDEVILIGSCKGKTYGEVKNSSTFQSFMRWVKNNNMTYPVPDQQNQFLRFKKLSECA